MANHKVYNGEYSLFRWIELILSLNITIPEYQRSFVWNKEKVKGLITSIKNGDFIPTLTLASCKNNDGKTVNYIIDGQQRLTSILLAYIGYFPKQRNTNKTYFDENDKEIKPTGDEWTIKNILDFGRSKQEIRAKIQTEFAKEYYEFIIDNTIIDEKFLKEHYLQFSLIVPDSSETADKVNIYLTNVFYTINSMGTILSPLECRYALYFQGDNRDMLSPEVFKTIKAKGANVDFVRLLAMVSVYEKSKNDSSLKFESLIGKKDKREDLYTKFVLLFVSNELDKFEKFVGFKNYKENLQKLQTVLEKLKLTGKSYSSIIDIDLVYSGLVYYIMIKENENVNESVYSEVKNELTKQKELIEKDDAHKKSPASAKNVKIRLEKSIEAYKKLFNEH